MSHSTAIGTPISTPIVTPQVKTVTLLLVTAILALLVYYFIGVDEGMTSVFGKSMRVHEFFHDGRHFLGFPCH